MKVFKETGQHNAILSKQDIEELQNYLNSTRRIDRITEKGYFNYGFRYTISNY